MTRTTSQQEMDHVGDVDDGSRTESLNQDDQHEGEDTDDKEEGIDNPLDQTTKTTDLSKGGSSREIVEGSSSRRERFLRSRSALSKSGESGRIQSLSSTRRSTRHLLHSKGTSSSSEVSRSSRVALSTVYDETASDGKQDDAVEVGAFAETPSVPPPPTRSLKWRSISRGVSRGSNKKFGQSPEAESMEHGSSAATTSVAHATEMDVTSGTTNTEGSNSGAHAIQGRAFGAVPRWARDESSSEDEEVDEESLVTAERNGHVTTTIARSRYSIASVRRGSSTTNLARADLIDNAEPIVQALNVESELKQRRRRNRIAFVLVALVIIAVVVSAVVVSTRKSAAPILLDGGVEEDPDKCLAVPPDDFLLQCECFGSLQEEGRPNTTEWELRGQIVRALQHESVLADDFLTNSSIDLCEPRNEVIWWMIQAWNNESTFHEQTAQFDNNTGAIIGEKSRRFFVDRFICALLFFSLNGREWKDNEGWLNTTIPYCEWSGIFCQRRGYAGRIFEIELIDNNLNGTLPSELALISYIRHLRVDENPLMRGTFPAAILDIPSLRDVDIGNNNLEGALSHLIPTNPNRSGLVKLLMDGNKFTGTLPSEYGLLPRVEKLEVGWNRLVGTIPTELGLLQNLEFLVLKSNQFRGTLPTELFNLQYLEQVDVSENMLTGPLPSTMVETFRLGFLDVSNNNFTGENRASQYCEEVDALDLIYVDCNDYENSDANGFCGDDSESSGGGSCRCVCRELVGNKEHDEDEGGASTSGPPPPRGPPPEGGPPPKDGPP